MAKTVLFHMVMILLVCLAQGSKDQEYLKKKTWMPVKASAAATTGTPLSWCKGTVAECLAGGGELEMMWMDSETNRRILGAESNFISYGALQRNTVPCSRRGTSYYNCQPGAVANPYTRGCNAITRCRS